MKYIAIRPKAVVIDGETILTGTTVVMDDDQPQSTGLLNADGVPLYRVSDRQPVGFHLQSQGVPMKKPKPGKKGGRKGC